jgi:hypothetical protein
MDGPVFRYTNTSCLSPLPHRAEGSHEPAPDAASTGDACQTMGKLCSWEARPSTGLSAAGSLERERPREPPVSRPHAGWMAVASITADAEFVNRSPRGPSRTGVLTRSPERTESQRIPRSNREKPTVRHGNDPNPRGTENPPATSPSQTRATTRTRRPRQRKPPGPLSTTLATQFRDREKCLPEPNANLHPSGEQPPALPPVTRPLVLKHRDRHRTSLRLPVDPPQPPKQLCHMDNNPIAEPGELIGPQQEHTTKPRDISAGATRCWRPPCASGRGRISMGTHCGTAQSRTISTHTQCGAALSQIILTRTHCARAHRQGISIPSHGAPAHRQGISIPCHGAPAQHQGIPIPGHGAPTHRQGFRFPAMVHRHTARAFRFPAMVHRHTGPPFRRRPGVHEHPGRTFS